MESNQTPDLTGVEEGHSRNPGGDRMTMYSDDGVTSIAAERERQRARYDLQHDDEHMSTTTTEAPSRPDLSALDEDTRIRIWVAEVRGAAWRKRRDGCWALSGGADLVRGAVVLLAHGQLHQGARSLLPRYLDDPAAWGRLVEAERISLTALHPDGWSGSPRVTLAYWGDSPGRAVCLAVLDKHGRSR